MRNNLQNCPEPPDGGYGWVIVTSYFIISFVFYGAHFSIGVLIEAFTNKFQCDEAEVTLAASIAFCLLCGMAPLVTPLLHIFPSRTVVVMGVLFCAASLMLSAIVPSAIFFYFSFGLLGGLGMSFVYLPQTVDISLYFAKRRSFAIAVSVMGATTSWLLFPAVIRFMYSVYGLEGALLVLGALSLNSLPAALLIRPVNVGSRISCCSSRRKSEEEETQNTWKSQPSLDDEEKYMTSQPGPDEEQIEPDTPLNGNAKTFQHSPYIRRHLPLRMGEHHRNFHHDQMLKRSLLLNRLNSETDGVVSSAMDLSPNGANDFLNMPQDYCKSADVLSTLVAFQTPTMSRQNSSLSSFVDLYGDAKVSLLLLAPRASDVHSGRTTPAGMMSRQISEVAPVITEEMDTIRENESDIASQNHSDKLEKDIQHDSATAVKVEESTGSKHICLFLQRFAFLLNWKILAITISSFLKASIFYLPTLFFVGHGTSIGFESNYSAMLLSISGFGNVTGRPVVAFLSDRLHRYRPELCFVLLGTLGALTMTTTLLPYYYYQAIFAFLYSFLLGGFQTQQAPIIADMIQLKELVNTLGFIIGIEGVGYLVGPPLLRLLPTYPLIFAAAGLVILINASIYLVICLNKRFSKKFCLTSSNQKVQAS